MPPKPTKYRSLKRVQKKKSKVTKSVMTKKGRRKKTASDWIKSIKHTKIENWGKNGEVVAKPKKIAMDLKKTKPNANIMILGPDQGSEVVFISEQTRSKKANIDTLGLGNQLTEQAKALVRKDYSPDLKNLQSKDLFEHMTHLKFVKKYDYIYSAYGPVLHTKLVEVSILKVASMLKPGGFARILPFFEEIPQYKEKINNIQKYLKSRNQGGHLDFQYDENCLIIKRLK